MGPQEAFADLSAKKTLDVILRLASFFKLPNGWRYGTGKSLEPKIFKEASGLVLMLHAMNAGRVSVSPSGEGGAFISAKIGDAEAGFDMHSLDRLDFYAEFPDRPPVDKENIPYKDVARLLDDLRSGIECDFISAGSAEARHPTPIWHTAHSRRQASSSWMPVSKLGAVLMAQNESDQATESAMDAQFRSSDSGDAKATAMALRAAILEHYDAVIGSVREFASAMIKLREPADLEETKIRVGRFAAAAVFLQATAEHASHGARDALAHANTDTAAGNHDRD